MKIQTKILLLLVMIVVTLVGGLTLLKLSETRKFRSIAESRAAERNRMFDEFLTERGDRLNVLVEDSTIWDDMVRAIVKQDESWGAEHISYETLATYQVNGVWIYDEDGRLFHSRNNRYADNLRELPLAPEALKALFVRSRTCHFFVRVPQGWMEIRGGTVHPSGDRYRETRPKGALFAGHIWIDENIRRMSMFTGYSIRIVPAGEEQALPPSEEERGLIRFSRVMPGWDGKPAAVIQVENDSPLIRELNRASERQFVWLMVFAVWLFLVLALSLGFWVGRPLWLISHNLERENPEALVPLSHRRDEFGELSRLILKFRRTEQVLQQTEEELRHAQKLEAVGRLAGGVAHDFNNLLTAIIGYSEMLERRLAHDDEACEQAQMIRKAGEQAAELTRQLLAFSRKQLLQPRVLELNGLVREMEKLLQRIIGEHIRISIEAAAPDSRVEADPNQLEQVILNLGVNARDAMPRGGALRIRTATVTLDKDAAGLVDLAPGDYVALTVTDTGAGMDAETKSRIFEPFFTTKGPGKGTGLGLATVYGIVRQSGGAITVESTPGQGSTFQILLPRVNLPLDAPLPELPPPDLAQDSETILVVEDEDVVRQLVCAVLSDAGYDVLCAECPTEAVRLVQQHAGPIDLLLTDVVMPEMHGPVLAALLSPLQPRMRVLYVSGYSDNDISDQCVVTPGLEVLQKPFLQKTLLRKVRQVLDECPGASDIANAGRGINATETRAASNLG
jgi:signal transduction histidine kinase/CheY-like chemotaxis protein